MKKDFIKKDYLVLVSKIDTKPLAGILLSLIIGIGLGYAIFSIESADSKWETDYNKLNTSHNNLKTQYQLLDTIYK